MEGSLFGLDLDWEGEVDNMDWTAVADDEILSCIEDFSGEDILWASVAIEREGINLFDSKVLDFLLSNEDADLIEKSFAALFKAEEGKNVLNNESFCVLKLSKKSVFLFIIFIYPKLSLRVPWGTKI